MKAFYPKPYESEPITVRVNTEKLRKIDRLAAEYKVSRSAFVNQCIDYAMEHMDMENEDDKPQEEG